MKVSLEIGEPRDFADEAGAEAVTGTVVENLAGERELTIEPKLGKVLKAKHKNKQPPKEDTYKEAWFVLAIDPLTYRGVTFSSLLLTPRYRSRKHPLEELEKGRDLVVNGIWRRDGKTWDAGSIEKARDGELEVEGVIVAKAYKAEG